MLRNRFYYLVKPFLPRPIRMRIRRAYTRGLRPRFENVWPILPGSEKCPQNWKGWPEGARFAFVLTHDVEGQVGREQVLKVMELEQKLGFTASYNFVPEGEYRVGVELRRALERNGFEVGVHDLHHDGTLYESRSAFAQHAARINHYLKTWQAAGFRSAFMFHELDWLHDLQISYDSSTFDTDPFEPQPDGAGTIFPFWVRRPGNHTNGRAYIGGNGADAGSCGYVELPYTLAQDSTLFLLLGETSPRIWMQKLDWIAKHGGMALVNIHPDYVDFDGRRTGVDAYPVQILEEFLEQVSRSYSGQFWNPCAGELARWYKETHVLNKEEVVS